MADLDEKQAGDCARAISRDLRTRVGRRLEIIEQIQENGGFSIFWVTEFFLRAKVAQSMQESGEIVTDNKSSRFPWIRAKIHPESLFKNAQNSSTNQRVKPRDASV